MKLKALCDSYGFIGRYHYKDSIVEVEDGTEFPKGQFEKIDENKTKNESEVVGGDNVHGEIPNKPKPKKTKKH